MAKSGLVLTAGDVEVFRWLWLLRVLTLGQIRRLRYYQPETGRLTAMDNVRKRMRRLWNAGFLVGDRVLETKERIYFLGDQAIPALRERYGIEQRRVYRPRIEAGLQLHHPLLVSECAVRVVESIRESDLELCDLAPLHVPFVHTHAIEDATKKKHIERFVSQEDLLVAGSSTPLRIRPDLVFGLRKGARGRLYFLEADRGFESPKEIATKLLGYFHFQQAIDPQEPARLRWQRYGDFADFRVLLVTTTPQRVQNLVRTLERQPGWNLAALTTEEAVKEKSMVFEGIWWNQQGEGRALAKNE